MSVNTSATKERDEAGGRGTLITLLASATLVVAAGSVISPVIAIIRDAFDLGPTLAGLAITTHSLLIAVFGPITGSVIDRVGTRRVLLAGLLSYGVFGAAGMLVSSYPLLLVTRGLFGISAAAVVNGLTVSLLNLWHGPARDTVMGYRATANSVGGLLWPLLGGLLGSISWRGPFAVYLVALPIALVAVRLVPDTGSAADARTASTPTVRMPTLLRRTPMLIGVYGLMFTMAMLLYAVVIFVPQRLAQLGITDPVIVSVFLSTNMAVTGLVGLLYGRIRRHLEYRPLLVTGLALPAAGFAVLTAADGPWILLAGTPLLGLGMGLITPSAPVLTGKAVPEQFRGRATSYLNSVMLLGQFASPLLFGSIAAPLGPRAVFAAAGVLAGLTAVLTAIAFGRDRTTRAPRGARSRKHG